MLAQAVVEGALRRIGRLGAGRAPRASDAQDTLDALKGLYQAWIASGAFGRLRDVIPTIDYTAGENERVFRNTPATLQITLPETVSDQWWGDEWGYGSRWVPPVASANPNVRPPRDCSVVVISDAFTAQTVTYIYSGALRLWQSIDGLTLEDEAPLSSLDPEGLRAVLATEVADQFGADITAQTAATAMRFRQSITLRYSMPRTEAIGEFV